VNSIRVVAAVLVAIGVAGCFGAGVAPGLPAGSRQWIVSVQNKSARPATLVVAEDAPAMGRTVGIADPGVVPAGITMDVVFGIPPGSGWAIFVNPGPGRGPLVTSGDVPMNAVGKMPFKIVIEADGSPGAQVPGFPGWFGN
jgi:hypothetical protein